MSDTLAKLIAQRFVQRRDVKATQRPDGSYSPVQTYSKGPEGQDIKIRERFKLRDILAHLEKTATYGHYLTDPNDMCRLFAFDIDLRQNVAAGHGTLPEYVGHWPTLPDLTNYGDLSDAQYDELVQLNEFDAREAWRDRAHPSRDWTKFQMRMLTGMIAGAAHKTLELPVATAYSGNKGVHVYCFTGPTSAADAREGAALVLETLGCFVPSRGTNFYRHTDDSPITGFPNFEIEVYPKQDSLGGKDLGNLMRLPLGRNQKTKDPTFFIDERLPFSRFEPHPDPVQLLETGNPWA